MAEYLLYDLPLRDYWYWIYSTTHYLKHGQRMTINQSAHLTKASFYLSHYGNPTDIIYCTVRDESWNILYTSPTQLNASTVTTGWYDFTLDVNVSGTFWVGLEYEGGDSNNRIYIGEADDSDLGNGNAYHWYDADEWYGRDRDVTMKLYFDNAESGSIDSSKLKFYKCATWTEGESHGGDIDLRSPLASGDIFDDVSDSERNDGDVEYRKIFIRNENLAVLYNTRVWISQNTPASDDEIYICASGTNSDTQQDASKYNYISPSGYSDGYDLGALGPHEYRPIWIRRVVTAGGEGYKDNSFEITVGQA